MLPLGRPISINDILFKAFLVEHSIIAPAVGLHNGAERSCLVYIPDVAEIPDRPVVLQGLDIYVGDGATVLRSMVRRKGKALIGHAHIATQLDWCKEAGVRKAIFTHCGWPIVRANPAQLDVLIRQLGLEHGKMRVSPMTDSSSAQGADTCRKSHDGRNIRGRSKAARVIFANAPRSRVS
jgi:hypothetical protein